MLHARFFNGRGGRRTYNNGIRISAQKNICYGVIICNEYFMEFREGKKKARKIKLFKSLVYF